MQRRTFISRLFRRKINPDDLAYWDFLYAEVLFRIKELEDLNCGCGSCFADKCNLKRLLTDLEEDGKIIRNKRQINFTGKGDCGRSYLPPRA